MSRTKNSKVCRTLDAIAACVYDCSDNLIREIHAGITDERDGYEFDFVGAVNTYRIMLGSKKLNVTA
ncbi:hypothetical protein LCGC14_1484080 [marine sediment metagenome]|uniref:Uncharacterized protein n=1 Tax=marine sediment metagenome TaxID=412755 RepID=A0A0F9LP28_9ZZZZ